MKLPSVPILSDLDGTLIDSKASVVAAFRWWAKHRGLALSVVGQIPFGRTSTDAAAVLAPHLNPLEEGRLLDDRQAQDTEGVVALEGARALLEHDRIAVVTSCPSRLASARLAAAGLRIPMHLLTPDCWSQGKPDPEPYLRGAEALKAKPADCIVLEDAPSGVQSGVAAGARVIGILTSHTPAQLSGASICIKSLLELPAAFHKLGIQ